MKVLIGPWLCVCLENTTQSERRRQRNNKRKHLSFFKYLSAEETIALQNLPLNSPAGRDQEIYKQFENYGTIYFIIYNTWCYSTKSSGKENSYAFQYVRLCKIAEYRSGTVNSYTVNSKFHLIRSFCEIYARFLSFHV